MQSSPLKSQPISVWHYKPWWCQPWSILLTGIVFVSGCYLVTRNLWLTGLATLPILVWWAYFLIIWPRLIRQSGILAELDPSKPGDTF